MGDEKNGTATLMQEATETDRKIPLGMEPREVTLTMEQGQHFLKRSLEEVPEQAGKLNFKGKALGPRLALHQLWKDLRKVSPRMLESKRRSMFGPSDAWKEEKFQGPDGREANAFEVKEPAQEVKVRLTREGVIGLYLLCVFMTVPESKMAVSIEVLDSVVFPVVQQLGYWGQFCEETGIADIKPHELKTDEEREVTQRKR